MHKFCFENKTAVVTGGARGIGRCIAEEFARHGAQVHVIDIAPGEYYVGDVSDPAVLEAFVKEITRGGAKIDYLINNALEGRGYAHLQCAIELFPAAIVDAVHLRMLAAGGVSASVHARYGDAISRRHIFLPVRSPFDACKRLPERL